MLRQQGLGAAATAEGAADGLNSPAHRARGVAIANQELRDAFLSPEMHCYFRKKFAYLDGAELVVRIEEALKFLNMATFCEGSIPVTQEIDDIWHSWILETREYTRLCQRLAGGEFVHHCSNAYAECSLDGSALPVNDIEQDVAMLANYFLNYGPFDADRIKYWHLAEHLVGKCGMTVDELNAWLASDAATSPAG